MLPKASCCWHRMTYHGMRTESLRKNGPLFDDGIITPPCHISMEKTLSTRHG